MAISLNFRSAIGGFNREDVAHYIEFMNSKYNSQINQLTGEAEELHRKLEQVTAAPDLSEEVAQLTAQLEEAADRQALLEQENARLVAEHEKILSEIEELKANQAENTAQKLASLELEAYRRAEQAERAAKVRAEQIYQQATGTLAQTTTQVDNAANSFKQVAEQISGQMQLLQAAIDDSRNALLDAATTMYAIRPQGKED